MCSSSEERVIILTLLLNCLVLLVNSRPPSEQWGRTSRSTISSNLTSVFKTQHQNSTKRQFVNYPPGFSEGGSRRSFRGGGFGGGEGGGCGCEGCPPCGGETTVQCETPPCEMSMGCASPPCDTGCDNPPCHYFGGYTGKHKVEEFDADHVPQIIHSHHKTRHHTHILHGRCEPNPCQNGGTCTLRKNGYECICPNGYMGQFCHYKSKCFVNPCQNGGSCYENGNDFSCLCKTGFKGPKCAQRNPCQPNPCKNSGSCTEVDSGYQCSCPVAFMGVICEDTNHCASNPCKNSGVCHPVDNNYECTCNIGYKGTNCKRSAMCSANPCLNGGACVELEQGYSCRCKPGYTGDTCSGHVCANQHCQNDGQCEVRNGQPFCMCKENFLGSTCSYANPCYNSPCENGGSCREYYEGNDAAGKVSFTCGCVEQFEGDRCEIDKCAKCHPYASCDRGRCQCKKNYKGDGETCTKVSSCEPNPCMNGGACVENANSYDCTCVQGFTGPNCEDKKPCDPNPCNGGGRCIPQADGNYACNCPDGLKGKNCDDKDPCYQNPCQHGGKCTEYNGGASCECVHPRYTGEMCSGDTCANCHTNAECSNSGKCVCRPGFIGDGENCEAVKKGAIAQGLSGPAPSGVTVGSSSSGSTLSKSSGPENSGSSGGKGTGSGSLPISAQVSNPQVPQENSPHSAQPLPAASDKAICHPNPCLNGGQCKDTPNGGFDCICLPQFKGALCEVDKCSECDPHAMCDSSGKCTCKKGYAGNGIQCEIDPDAPKQFDVEVTSNQVPFCQGRTECG